MYDDIMEYYSQISDLYDDIEKYTLHEIFDSLQFKLNKNAYHLENIKSVIETSRNIDTENYYKSVNLPIYYEVESFLVSLRSSVDVLLHLLNFCLRLNLQGNEVYISNIYYNKNVPKIIKNIFDRYTRPFDNPTWTFIYTSRNEIVHEKSVNQILPIKIDVFTAKYPLVFLTVDNNEREIVIFFNQCINFMQTFTMQILQAIKVSV